MVQRRKRQLEPSCTPLPVEASRECRGSGEFGSGADARAHIAAAAAGTVSQLDDCWQEGAPPPLISIHQLFYPGVCEVLQDTIDDIAASLLAAERAVCKGEHPSSQRFCWVMYPRCAKRFTTTQNGHVQEYRRHAIRPRHWVPVQPCSEDNLHQHDLSPKVFTEWGHRLRWLRARWDGGSRRSSCTIHLLGLHSRLSTL